MASLSLGLATPTHLAWQETSPSSQAARQVAVGDSEVLVPLAVSTVEDWAVARTATRPVVRTVVKRMVAEIGWSGDRRWWEMRWTGVGAKAKPSERGRKLKRETGAADSRTRASLSV